MNAAPHIPGTRRRIWLRRFAVAFTVWLAVHLSLAGFVSTRRVQRALAARITAAFGRPVEVSNFGISILEGPRLVANYVTVSEDPRFGREHFLRADRLTASIHWTALLRGRLEFDTVSFTRPSLNLVRNPDGAWNLESWIPRPRGQPAASAGELSVRQTIFTRINIDTGRINFKRGVDKHPFAFTNVDGFVERDATGHWRVDLEASVMRAAVTLQEPGTIRLRGSIGSAASRLQPAELELTWTEASLSDALRLVRGFDYGVRGNFELTVTASVPQSRDTAAREPAVWSFKSDLRLIDVHSWNQPRRSSDPDLNLSFEAKWTPQLARVDFARILLDAPKSNIRAGGFLQWAQPKESSFRVLSTGISLNDVFEWYRAFRPGVAPEVSVEGSAGLDAELGGWPVAVRQASLASDGAQMKIPGLRDPLRVGRAVLRWTPEKMELLPVPFTLAPAAAALSRPKVGSVFQFEFSGHGQPLPRNECRAWLCGDFSLALGGQTDRFQDFLAITRALGWPLDGGWAVEGSANFSVIWQARLSPFVVDSQGSIHFAGTRILPPFLNQPVLFKDAFFAWTPPLPLGAAAKAAASRDPRPGERRLTLLNSEVFGGKWTGTVSSLNRAPWEFSLAADRLEIAAINQWLNPRQPPGLFQRMVASSATRRGSAEYEDQLGRLRARGQVRVDLLTLVPISLQKLRGTLELDGRKISLTDAQADFYSGAVSGSLRAELAIEPKYEVQAKVERVNLAALTAATVTLKSLFSGTASGELSLSTRGIGRENLLRSIDGLGAFEFRDAQFRGLDLAESIRADAARPGVSSFRTAFARVNIAASKFQLEEFRLTTSSSQWEAEGAVDFARQLDLRLHMATPSASTFNLTGPLSAPLLVRAVPDKKP